MNVPEANAERVSECGSKAVLIITATMEGTATNVALSRVELSCRLPANHEGEHRDTEEGESWQAAVGEVSMILRHEDEA